MYISDLSFKFGFSLRVSGSYQSGHILEIYVGESYLEQIILKHNIDDIRFLSLSGDVAKVEDLEFKFAWKPDIINIYLKISTQSTQFIILVFNKFPL